MDSSLHQAPPSMGFSRQEYCHFLLQGIFPTQGLNPGLSHCRQTLTVWATREVSAEVCIEERSSPKPQLNFTMWKHFTDTKTTEHCFPDDSWGHWCSGLLPLDAGNSRPGLPPAASLPVGEFMSSRASSHSLGGESQYRCALWGNIFPTCWILTI